MKETIRTNKGNIFVADLRYSVKEHNPFYCCYLNREEVKAFAIIGGFSLYQLGKFVAAPTVAEKFLEEEKRLCHADQKRVRMVEEIENENNKYDPTAHYFE